jgi:O-antigen ligase
MRTLSLLLSLTFSVWLIVRDCIRRKSVSSAVWIPTLLLLILASRPVSLWLGGGKGNIGTMGNEQAVNPVDQLFNLFILLSSVVIATVRGFKWGKLVRSNSAIMLFYLYFAISVAWSGDPIGSFKRIVKDFGLLAVIGVIATEKDRLQAMRAVFLRCAYVLIPLSVVFIKYFPEYSRAYTIAGDITITGVTTQKNSLGEIVLVFTIFIVWDYLETRRKATSSRRNQFPWDRIALLVMGAYLLQISQSKTALLCTLTSVFLISRWGWLVSRPINRAVLAGALSLPLLLFCSQQFSAVIAPFIEALGRNMTFTGRTNIWEHINLSTVNPVIGAGYWNFWGGPGGYAISKAMDTIVPNAHCGYVDIYIDGGFLGLGMLFFMLTTCGNRIVKYLRDLDDADRYLRVRLATLVASIIYNLSESTFFRLGPIWFTTLLMLVDLPMTNKIANTAVRTLGQGRASIHSRRSSASIGMVS